MKTKSVRVAMEVARKRRRVVRTSVPHLGQTPDPGQAGRRKPEGLGPISWPSDGSRGPAQGSITSGRDVRSTVSTPSCSAVYISRFTNRSTLPAVASTTSV